MPQCSNKNQSKHDANIQNVSYINEAERTIAKNGVKKHHVSCEKIVMILFT